MDRQIDYKALSSGVQDVDVKKGIVCSYYSSFNTVDRIKDVLLPGAFTKTITETGPQGSGDIAHLQDHNKNLTVGMFQLLKEDVKAEFGHSGSVSYTHLTLPTSP
jgi:phage head maturation protease